MADRVHPAPPPAFPSPSSPSPDHKQQQATEEEATPLHHHNQQQQHPSFHRPPPPLAGTYVVHVPKDQVLRVPPPDRARRYKKLANRPARRQRLRRACCLSCSALLLLLVLCAAAFAGAVYLVFRPRAPSFSVGSLSFRGLDDPLARSSSSFSPDLIIAAVRADNGRNKKVAVDYRGGGAVAVSYSGARLAAGPWPAFRQAPRNVTVLSALSLRGEEGGVTLTEEQRRRLAAEQAAGAVPLTVEATVPVRLRFGNVLRTWTVDVKATCDVAVDRLAGTGTAAAVTSRGCRVRVKPLWWWW